MAKIGKVEWKLEDDVDDYVKEQLEELNLKKLVDYNVQSSMSDYMKEALKGSAKTKKKTSFGIPLGNNLSHDIYKCKRLNQTTSYGRITTASTWRTDRPL
ncbi:hypothetical protein [Cellulosilyticum lentocellum]|uniref:Uncharacterized protein n=1 Tax=Cellulosilyticum lentocellum (strain ATCC 49066 / DSM 5427 / NCIMB 11756 / RHM5) TaxID=642492 RepID=F2JKX0_CELLD|nr:hypothetical protein [Cellulosilyticum lentocellum]ADZ84511.1 hypothetical protein Clole_2812 [Cellulosilyticum lentocellum DSM 5427]